MFRVGALAFAILSPAAGDTMGIAEAYMAEVLAAFKASDQAKLDELYSPTCVFGDSDAGTPGEQKDVLMVGLGAAGGPGSTWWSTGKDNEEFRDDIVGIKVMSVNQITAPPQITVWAKVEVKKGKWDDFYQWVTLVPKCIENTWFDCKGDDKKWLASSVLLSAAPASASTAELLEQPGTAGDASDPVTALPGPLAFVATFASGAILSGLVCGRKEILSKLMAPKGLQEPLLC
jgi:hypothetical protein